MRDDDLIDRLTADLTPASFLTVPARLVVVAVSGAVCAFVLMILKLHIRPDLAQAFQTWAFWFKAGYAVMMALAGALALERLARPVGDGRRGFVLAVGMALVMASAGAWRLLTASDERRLDLWLGASWRSCPFNILLLACPMTIIALIVVRRLAPTRPTATGAACGLFSAGVAATVYCLHCPEMAPAFVATWYGLGMTLTAGAGALLGTKVLRWT